MADKVLPLKYAEALFTLAGGAANAKNVREELDSVRAALDSEPKFRAVMMHPGVSREDKKSLIKNIFGGKISATAMNFIMLIIDKKRERIFDAVCEAFGEKVDDSLNLKKITIETAYPLTADERGTVVRKLEKAMKSKLTVDARVNQGMMGGIIIREKMRLIDASVIQFINSLKKSLKSKSAVPVEKPVAKKTAVKKAADKPAKKAAAKKAAKKPVKKVVKPKKKK